MGEGLNNSAYAYWLNETAAQDCSEVASIEITYADETEDTLTDSWEICSWMEDTDASQIADVNEVKFSGTGTEGQWYAIDARVDVNLERTDDNGVVPVKIRRPKGQ